MKTNILAWFMCFLLVANNALAQNAEAIDGDSLRVDGIETRLWGIDAPEYNQKCKVSKKTYRCGGDAAKALRELVNNKPVTCETKYKDKYGRDVATCTTDGKDIGEAMVRAGWAIDYMRYSKGYYSHAEGEARQEKRGIWTGYFDKPEAWRHSKNNN